jgi:hypothetical protein
LDEPPVMLDGTRVVEYAVLDRAQVAASRSSISLGGIPVDFNELAGVVIAESLAEGGYYLLHCNKQWETLAAAHYTQRDSARESATRAYAGLTVPWQDYRELTAVEAKEVETTRKFLHDLKTDFPDD